MRYEAGNWQVTRNCCRSGNCFLCRGALTGKGCVRMLQADGYSQAYAEYVARNWDAYKATAEPIGVTPTHV